MTASRAWASVVVNAPNVADVRISRTHELPCGASTPSAAGTVEKERSRMVLSDVSDAPQLGERHVGGIGDVPGEELALLTHVDEPRTRGAPPRVHSTAPPAHRV